jgi:plastocyanin domain-containing protein
MQTKLIVPIAISIVVVGWAFWLVSGKLSTASDNAPAPTAVITDGKQIIDITAKGGYTPRVVVAKAGMPTTLRVATSGTFDCSSSIVIPKLGYQKFLKPTGTEDIAISAEQAQGTLQGTCSMGMYNFQIKFQ